MPTATLLAWLSELMMILKMKRAANRFSYILYIGSKAFVPLSTVIIVLQIFRHYLTSYFEKAL